MKIQLRVLAGFLVLLGLAGLVRCFRTPPPGGQLEWEPPVVKKALMTFAYQAYGNPAAQNGRNFLSKIVFHNKGKGPVHDFSVSYQIPDYLPWTTPELPRELRPGQTAVQLFYPQLPSKVAQLTSKDIVTLEMKIHWSDKPGRPKEEVLHSKVELRGVREVEYSDLPAGALRTWSDQFANAPFIAAMVTPDDPAVKEFAAGITRRTGGMKAGVSGGAQEIARVMQAVYDCMCETGMRSTGDSGVPGKLGDISTVVQTVRLPREVIDSNQGSSIELALLWASVMEQLGLRATVVFRPGHAFTLVSTGEGPGDFIPIECLAITPTTVGKSGPVAFADAVKMAQEELHNEEFQLWINVQQYQAQGFRPPDLPSIDVERIRMILAERAARKTVPAGPVQPNPQPTAQDGIQSGGERPLADGFYRYASPGNWVTVDIPAHWVRAESGPIKGIIFTAQDMQTTLGVNVFRYTDLKSSDDAVKTVQEEFASRIGVKLRINQRDGRDEDGNVCVYAGTATSATGTNVWAGLFQLTRGGVVGFVIGDNEKTHARNKDLMKHIVDSVNFGK